MTKEDLENVYITADMLPSHDMSCYTYAWDWITPISYKPLPDYTPICTTKTVSEELDEIKKELEELKEKKEGKNMELLNLFEEKSEEVINDFFNSLIEEERENHPIMKAYKEFIAKYSMENEEKNKGYLQTYVGLTPIIHSDKIEWLKIKLNDWENELERIVEEVSAHLELAGDDYNQIITILKNYEVLDEEGKITPLMPYTDDKEFEEYLEEQNKEGK